MVGVFTVIKRRVVMSGSNTTSSLRKASKVGARENVSVYVYHRYGRQDNG
jgi:hypothetical protein